MSSDEPGSPGGSPREENDDDRAVRWVERLRQRGFVPEDEFQSLRVEASLRRKLSPKRGGNSQRPEPRQLRDEDRDDEKGDDEKGDDEKGDDEKGDDEKGDDEKGDDEKG
eukprot:Hpha_TRINITY_DN10507_c0_g1::TRINITY_DN10507_c0_g1_i2::g.31530::m.31530